MKISNLAELKRLPVGAALMLVKCEVEHEGKISTVKHRYLMQVRTIEKMQTNALKLSGDSWLYFPKAQFFKAEEDGFSILPKDKWGIKLSYKVIV